jgi:hypothetical protein
MLICVAVKFKWHRWGIGTYSLNLELIYLSLIIASSNETKLMLVYILASESCFFMPLLEFWQIVTCYVCLCFLLLFLGEFVWFCYTS